MPNLDPGGLLFNTVSSFVEQVGRRRAWKYAQLDQMRCVWNGPAQGASNFRPKVGAPHPQFPLMICQGADVTNQAALIAEITADYIGIMQSNGAKRFLTDPILSTTPSQGSRDFEIQYVHQMTFAQYATNATQLATPQGPYQYGPLYIYGSQKVSVRYVGDSVSIKYFIWPSVNVDSPNFASLGISLVGWHILSEQFGEITVIGSWNGPGFDPTRVVPGIPNTSPPLRAAFMGMSTTPIAPKWFEVTESYGATF